jgi:hypothetical protein
MKIQNKNVNGVRVQYSKFSLLAKKHSWQYFIKKLTKIGYELSKSGDGQFISAYAFNQLSKMTASSIEDLETKFEKVVSGGEYTLKFGGKFYNTNFREEYQTLTETDSPRQLVIKIKRGK